MDEGSVKWIGDVSYSDHGIVEKVKNETMWLIDHPSGREITVAEGTRLVEEVAQGLIGTRRFSDLPDVCLTSQIVCFGMGGIHLARDGELHG